MADGRFGEITSSVTMAANESIRRNAANNAFEAFTPAAGISLLDVYPVGAVYISVDSTAPNTLFGGTWAVLGAGRVLVGIDVGGDADFDTAEETGGAKTVASSAQTFAGTPSTVIVNHVHAENAPSSASGGALTMGIDTNASGSQAVGLNTGNPVSGGAASYTPAGTNTPGAATSVVQPYLVVYMWKRTA